MQCYTHDAMSWRGWEAGPAVGKQPCAPPMCSCLPGCRAPQRRHVPCAAGCASLGPDCPGAATAGSYTQHSPRPGLPVRNDAPLVHWQRHDRVQRRSDLACTWGSWCGSVGASPSQGHGQTGRCKTPACTARAPSWLCVPSHAAKPVPTAPLRLPSLPGSRSVCQCSSGGASTTCMSTKAIRHDFSC